MKKYVYLLAFLTLISVSSTISAAVLGTINLQDYEDFSHDSVGNTLAIKAEWDDSSGDDLISSCTFYLFNKKGTQKISVNFDTAIGYEDIDILYFEKNWAIIELSGDEDKVFSVKITKKTVVTLGEILTDEFNYRFTSGKNIVSYVNSGRTCQLYNQKLEKVGSAESLIGRPHSLNDGNYFYCEDANKIQIYKVKKGFEKIIDEAGDYKEINEQKRICCIENNDYHKICKY